MGPSWSKGLGQMELGRVRSFMNKVVEFLESIGEPQKDPEPRRWHAQETFEAAQWQNQVTLALKRLGEAAFSGGSPG